MALTASLIPGFQYRVARGPLAGEVVTIVNNVAFPDGHPQQRKITVEFDGQANYILPRLLDSQPISNQPVALQGPAPAPTTGPITTMEDLAVSVAVQPLNDPMDPRLDFLRPRRSRLKQYIHRKMVNGMTDIEFLLQYASPERRGSNDSYPVPFALKGDTQSGKTLAVEVLAIEWADYMGYPKPMPIFTLSGSSGVTDFDLFGQPASFEGEIIHLMGTCEMAAKAGGILYFDEINAMSERVTTALFSLLDHRHRFTNRAKPILKGGLHLPETVQAHFDMWPVATYNEGYEGMVKLNKAVHQRFEHILWDYDPAVEAKLVDSPTVLEIGRAFRQARAARTGISTPVSTALLQRIEQNIESFGVDGAVEVFLGMFEARERGTAKDILTDRSLIAALHEEAKQRALNADPVAAASDDLINALNNPVN